MILKRVGVYSREGAHVVAKALDAGLKLDGHLAIHRSLSDYGDNDVERFAAVFVLGLRGKGAKIVRDYTKRGTPTLVVDYGYLRRVHGEADYVTGHWQVGVGGLNRLPSFPCPSDRFNALDIEIQPGRERAGPVILCGQSVGDAVHPFDTPEKLKAWIESVPHDEYRPHPLEATALEPLHSMLARAGRIVTWNSNIGHDALLAGVPVDVHGDAPYAGVTMADRAAYFARVAYGQWTVDEMARGLTHRFVFNNLLLSTAPALPPEEVPIVPQVEEPKRRARNAR